MKKLNEMSMYEIYMYFNWVECKNLCVVYIDEEFNSHTIIKDTTLEDLYNEWCDETYRSEEHIFAKPIEWFSIDDDGIRVCMKGHEW